MVVLTLKNLQQQTFSVEIELSSSVRELKEKIEKENGSEYPAEGQKLIYAGKILQDDSNLESYNIDAKKFLVIMVTKPKAPPPSSAPSDPTIVAAEAAAAEETVTTEEEPSKSESPSATTTTSSTSSTTPAATTTTTSTTSCASTGSTAESAESLIVMGEEFNRMVENIMEMGYERSQVERALRASFNNPYTAVQYLVDGIPSNLEYSTPATGANPPASRQGAEETEGGEDERGGTGTTGSPTGTGSGTGGTGTGTGSAPAPASGTPRAASGQNTILVSPQDRDAIERLKALGNFPEDVVVQAYFACEKNENLAAEFLFSQTWD